MAGDTEAEVERQRAQENERLRRLAAHELASMRIELTRALEDRVELLRDLNLLAERLSVQENKTPLAQGELDVANDTIQRQAATIQRQAAHIARLKQQVARPMRILAKKILRRSPKQSGANSAS